MLCSIFVVHYLLRHMNSLIKSLIVVSFLFWSPMYLLSQEEVVMSKDFTNEDPLNSMDWVPTLLNANKSALFRMAQYNGFVFSWTLRGSVDTRITIIDGLNWNSNLAGWNAGFSYAGLYKGFRKDGNIVNNELSDLGYGANGSAQYFNSNANSFKKSIVLGTGISNNSYVNSSNAQWSSGKLGSNWYVNMNLAFQVTPNGLLPNGFKKIKGILISIEKIVKYQQSFGFTFWWDINSQGKMSPSVQEAIDLSSLRNYNPSWGWYHGNALYPNSKQNNAPVFSIRHQKRWQETTSLNSSIGIVLGNQKQTSLDWTNTFDPRPDYYRYMPSYLKDTGMQASLIDWFQRNPQSLQINFDQLEKVNQSSATKRSFNIINTQIAELLLLRAATKFQCQINYFWQASAGIELAKDRVHYYSQIEHLLGGNYFYNYNGWVNDDGVPNNFQNDLQHPDKKIVQGEIWGANYILNAIQTKSWAQLKMAGKKLELAWAFHYSQDWLSRTGLNQNGLFPNVSLGSSEWIQYPSYGYKAEVLYKISGRLYLRSIFFNQWEAPSSSTVYLNPGIHPYTAPFLLPEIHQGVDLSFFYRGVNLKIMMSAYYKTLQNQSDKKMFYHDRYNSFVYGVLGQMNSVYKGLEFSIETKLWGAFQVELASTVGSYKIANNPLYDILLVNDLYKVESGLLYVKNMPASVSPEMIHSFSVQYQPSYFFTIGLSGVYAIKRPIHSDLFRRSDWVQRQVSGVEWDQIAAPIYSKDQFVFNTYIAKSFQVKTAHHALLWRSSLSIRNILNTLIPVLVFEQSRFDYIHFQTQKYAPKFLYDPGTTYSLSFQLQIQ